MAKALYVHIPFCNSMCAYCNFAKVIYNPKLVADYLKVLEAEILSKDLSRIESIYIGGGTPSALSLNELETLLEILAPYSNNLVEYTIEINPGSLDLKKAELLAKYNVNRASIGMQVTQEHLLKIIDRNHDLAKTIEAVNHLRSVGINNLSIDLMYGIPTQTLDDLAKSIAEIVKLDVNHLSLYALTIEPNTKLERLNYQEIDDELDADMYELAVNYLNKAHLKQYEVSNFAKSGYESFHNKVYWNYADFVGVGLSAAGKENGIRYNNTRDLKKYLSGDYDREIVKLSESDAAFEFIMMNLRLLEGFKLNKFKALFGFDFKVKYQNQINKLQKAGLLIVDDTRVKTTFKGLELLFDVLEEFME